MFEVIGIEYYVVIGNLFVNLIGEGFYVVGGCDEGVVDVFELLSYVWFFGVVFGI